MSFRKIITHIDITLEVSISADGVSLQHRRTQFFHHRFISYSSVPSMANAKHVEFSGQTQPVRKLVFKTGAGMC